MEQAEAADDPCGTDRAVREGRRSGPELRSTATEATTDTPSACAPLRNATFLALFVATTVSNVGTWMQDVGRAWLMTELTPSPMNVALVQTAGMAALLLFSLPAGAAADAGRRRRLLILAQAAMLATSAAMGILTILHAMTPTTLLVLTFASAAAAAFTGPAWQAALPSLVGKRLLPGAVTLNGLSFNAARAIGPAIGGAVVAAAGPAAVFFLNAASFVGVLVALAVWREPTSPPKAAPEPMRSALRAGLRYAVTTISLRNVLVRTALLATPASALWALLPIIARQRGGSPGDYGTMLALIGAGAVVTAFALPPLRARLGSERLLLLAG